MTKAIMFDLSRTLINPTNPYYGDSLNSLYKRESPKKDFNALDHFKLNLPLLDFASDLKETRALYIFTTGNIQEDVHFKSFLDKIFKQVFTVDEIGYKKDQKEAHCALANKLSLLPYEIIFIDDTMENIEAANQAGLKTVHMKSNQQVMNEISSLMQS